MDIPIDFNDFFHEFMEMKKNEFRLISDLDDVSYDDLTVNLKPVYVLVKVAYFGDVPFAADSDKPIAELHDEWVQGEAWKEGEGVVIMTPKLRTSNDLLIHDYDNMEKRMFYRYNLPRLKKR